jgi:hypothetical protein
MNQDLRPIDIKQHTPVPDPQSIRWNEVDQSLHVAGQILAQPFDFSQDASSNLRRHSPEISLGGR